MITTPRFIENRTSPVSRPGFTGKVRDSRLADLFEPMHRSFLSSGPAVDANYRDSGGLPRRPPRALALGRALRRGVRNPKVSRAFQAMEQFASERLRTRTLAVLPQH
jgi:hypothetical protein